MKLFLLVSLFFISGFAGMAQQEHFVYFQSDNRQPFYVVMEERLRSSSETGYLIISKLPEGTVRFKLGFPQNKYPEHNFELTVTQDGGYLLKDFGEKGWGLFNQQTMAVIMGTTNTAKNPVIEKKNEVVAGGTMKTDAFSVLLANVVNDSSILYSPVMVAKTEEKPVVQEPVTPPIPPTPTSISTPTPTPTVVQTTVNINMISAEQKEDVYAMIFVDNTDTITVQIPLDKTTAQEVPTMQQGNVKLNANCPNYATDHDVDKLRVSLIALKTTEEKINAAKKVFKLRCFTVRQLKALTELFPDDESRYQFYDAAYPHTSDLYNFSSLVEFIQSEYYINRFKAMLR